MTFDIRVGDCLEVLRTMPDESVQMCVTSPPYFGLRDYGTAKWSGGDDSCDHLQKRGTTRGGASSTLSGGQDTAPHATQFAGCCGKCGATRSDSQLGLEKTPAEYVEKMVAVFREVRRVLRDDGTLWLNIGDSYSGANPVGRRDCGDGELREGSAEPDGSFTKRTRTFRPGAWKKGEIDERGQRNRDGVGGVEGLPAKNLIGIPWMLAFALRADGWYLRSDIIWHKPNPMPESVTDRPTKAHEYLFLLTKSATYYYDAEAIAEPVAPSQVGRVREDVVGGTSHVERGQHSKGGTYKGSSFNRGKTGVNGEGRNQSDEDRSDTTGQSATRNKRTVWTVTTTPYSGAHFATFPPKLIEPCILAGSSPQSCEECRAPWERVVERTAMVIDRSDRTHEKGRTRSSGTMVEPPTSQTVGWTPTCKCENDGIGKSVVLDPFGGAGTTALVADRLGRDSILIELNPEYAEMARRRITDDAPLFAGDAA